MRQAGCPLSRDDAGESSLALGMTHLAHGAVAQWPVATLAVCPLLNNTTLSAPNMGHVWGNWTHVRRIVPECGEHVGREHGQSRMQGNPATSI